MPVVVTGASGFVGRALIERLREGGSEVRGVVRRNDAAEPLRALGIKVAVGDVRDPELMAAVVQDAHTVCHLVGGLFPPAEELEPLNLGTTLAVLNAAREAKVARFLFLSCAGADASSPNPFLRAKGLAEEAVRSSGLEHVVVRSALVLGSGAPWLWVMGAGSRGPVSPVIGPGSQRLAPVFVQDAAAVLAAADDRAQPVTGTFGLQGPDTVTADELADVLTGRRYRFRVHVPTDRAARVVRLRRQQVSRPAAEVLASDSLAGPPDAAAEFGVKPTPLREGLRASGFEVS